MAPQSGPSGNWLITGASSGLGEALADAVLDKGGTVIATFRKAEQCSIFEARAPGRSFAVQMDVTDAESVQNGVDSALNKAGRIDVLVNNAGYALRGLVEQVSDDEAWHQLDTNVMGIIRVTRAILPAMRKQGAGRIINISSTAGSIGFPMLGLYSASKFAVVGLTESLAGEVSQFGIHVTSVEPGGFRTKFGSSSMITPARKPPQAYDAMVSHMDANMANFAERMPGNPDLAAQKLLALGEMDNPPVRLALGDDALPMISNALKGRLETYETHAALGQGTSDR
ncbi:MAG: SDR family NAD(P)-dependent oxidoreductase [Sphingomonadaceae bacterium]